MAGEGSARARASGAQRNMEAQRLSQLKTQLSRLRYDQPLGTESAPLVERLLDDLMKSNERQAELSALAEKRASEIAVAEQHVLPVRKENTRLVRENNELHMQIIADAEAAEAACVDACSSQIFYGAPLDTCKRTCTHAHARAHAQAC